jgi:hypothetical protein
MTVTNGSVLETAIGKWTATAIDKNGVPCPWDKRPNIYVLRHEGGLYLPSVVDDRVKHRVAGYAGFESAKDLALFGLDLAANLVKDSAFKAALQKSIASTRR